mmetsp:Transcript_20582/g.31480  ORF Transcript_20582/g.31480 Transcript_20582/m.31480 type:complete len:230 (-) Transcript_20582:75-764(-)
MDSLSSDLLSTIFSYLPPKQYLPMCHVNKFFYNTWCRNVKDSTPPHHDCCVQTDPLSVLFDGRWNQPNQKLSRSLFIYYAIDLGWNTGAASHHCAVAPAYASSQPSQGKNMCSLCKLAWQTVVRGDVQGFTFLFEHQHLKFCLDQIRSTDTGLCTVAAAAGHLEMLCMLRDVVRCNWDPVEVYIEAHENGHCHVTQYLENHLLRHARECMLRAFPYGEGLPAADTAFTS